MSVRNAFSRFKAVYRTEKFRDTVQVYFVAVVWIGLFVLMFAYDREKLEFARLHSTSPSAPTSPALVKGVGGAPLPVQKAAKQEGAR